MMLLFAIVDNERTHTVIIKEELNGNRSLC